jgi:hypothetical protein
MAFITGVGKGPYDAEKEAKAGAWKKSGLGPFDSQKKTVSEMKAAFDKAAAKKKADIDYSNSLTPAERSKKVDEVLGKVPQDSYMDDDGGKPTKTATKSTSVSVTPSNASKKPMVIEKESVEIKPASNPKPSIAPSKMASPAKSSRNSMADEWAAFSKGREADTAALKDITDRYKQTGTLVKKPTSSEQDETSAEDMNTQGKLPEGMKKGGMTKRPPKPAKKVPPRKFASGGSTSRTSASKRGDGCATKGHTKGKYL